MLMRRNALLGTARMIEAIHQVGLRHLPGVASVGLIENRPNSRNVVPGEVFFTIDLRHPDESVLDQMESEVRGRLAEIAAADKLDLDEKRIWISPAVKFAPPLIDCVKSAAAQCGFSQLEMASGAGHDSCYVAKVSPNTMIFVPCLGGLSHNEEEYASPEQCSAGAQVLLNAVLECDRRLGS
jgi:N-carbamoyl-L-amino-acid hydrolase